MLSLRESEPQSVPATPTAASTKWVYPFCAHFKCLQSIQIMNPIQNVAQISMRLWLTVFRGAAMRRLHGVGRGGANCNWHINHTQRGANSKHVYKFFLFFFSSLEIEYWSHTRSRDIIATAAAAATGGSYESRFDLCRFRQSSLTELLSLSKSLAVSMPCLCLCLYLCLCLREYRIS